MFWGSFAGDRKGPFKFWEKEWGSMNSERFCLQVLPVILVFLRIDDRLDLATLHARWCEMPLVKIHTRGAREVAD
jgi:hypothetical protein